MRLSPHAELLNLHQQIYRQNKKLIADSVLLEDPTFKNYERRYLEAVQYYQAVSGADEVEAAMMRAQVIYVGDYHTLNQSQRSFLRLLRSFVRKTSQIGIAMELIQARHQDSLKRYMKGRLADETFLNKIGFREHWFFDLWPNFRPIFDFSRYHHIPITGIEAPLGEGLDLKSRDRFMAEQIFKVHGKDPFRKIFVFVGDLHLAPTHLPLEVLKVFRKNGKPLTTVTLYQNSESIYWKLAAKGIEAKTMVVRLDQGVFCRMHTPPIICQQSYLNWLEHEEEVLDYADAKHTFLGYLQQIADFLNIPLSREKDDVEVFTCGDLSFLKRLKEAKSFSASELKAIKRQILRSESYYIPKKKIVYLANVSVNHASEEAAHTLRHLCAGEEFPRTRQDAFYANALHEALGFFGSKIINHQRKCLRPADSRQWIHHVYASQKPRDKLMEYQIHYLFLEHEKSAKRQNPFNERKITPMGPDLFLGVTHAIGYYLGERMFYGLLSGKIAKEKIKAVFYDPLKGKGVPVNCYLALIQTLKGVGLPHRL